MFNKLHVIPIESLVVDGTQYYSLRGKYGKRKLPTIKVKDNSPFVSKWSMSLNIDMWKNIHSVQDNLPKIVVNGVKPRTRLVIIDGQNLVYRSYYALPGLSYAGLPTGAIKGFINQVARLRTLFKDSHLVFVFDSGGITLRHLEYPEYKATRSTPPDDLVSQIKCIKQVVRKMGYPVLSKRGVEADDIIGTIVKKHVRKSTIYSSDKDFAQLVNKRVSLYDTKNNKLLDTSGVVDKFGVTTSKICDLLMLLGDSSDNIPGIKGCGPKTACKWINEYGGVEGVLSNIDKLSKKLGAAVADNQFELTKSLVTIRKVDMDTTLKFSATHESLERYVGSFGIKL